MKQRIVIELDYDMATSLGLEFRMEFDPVVPSKKRIAELKRLPMSTELFLTNVTISMYAAVTEVLGGIASGPVHIITRKDMS